MVDADERDVVDLVGHVLQTTDGGLVLARQVGERRVAPSGGRSRRSPTSGRGPRRATRRPRASRAPRAGSHRMPRWSAVRRRPAAPRSGDVLDPDPVVLDVLTVTDVGGIAGELGGDLADGAQTGGRERAAVAAHPHHEVLGLEDVGVLVAGPRAVVALLTLGVEAHPAHPAPQVVLVDAVEALLGVDLLDPGADVERVVVLLELLVGVERFPVPECPLALVPRRQVAAPFRSAGSCDGAPQIKELTFELRETTGELFRRRRSGGQLEYRWAGLRRQARQQQVQTRLKSTCRRATSATLRTVWGRACRPTCRPLCHEHPPRLQPGQICARRGESRALRH